MFSEGKHKPEVGDLYGFTNEPGKIRVIEKYSNDSFGGFSWWVKVEESFADRDIGLIFARSFGRILAQEGNSAEDLTSNLILLERKNVVLNIGSTIWSK